MWFNACYVWDGDGGSGMASDDWAGEVKTRGSTLKASRRQGWGVPKNWGKPANMSSWWSTKPRWSSIESRLPFKALKFLPHQCQSSHNIDKCRSFHSLNKWNYWNYCLTLCMCLHWSFILFFFLLILYTTYLHILPIIIEIIVSHFSNWTQVVCHYNGDQLILWVSRT